MTFEENADELAQDVRSLGYDLDSLVAQKKLIVDYIHVDRSEIEETGEYDLEGLVRAPRSCHQADRRQARDARHHRNPVWRSQGQRASCAPSCAACSAGCATAGITPIITAERGEQMFTRQGLEEYITDAVIALDHRVHDQISTRRIRVVKYRGSTHGTNEYPFLINRDGITVLPVTSLLLEHEAPNERISSGLPALDEMLGGKGYYRASTVLLSGTAGTGKTTLAAHFVDAACARGEKCLYFLFEESPQQLMRNMRAAGIDVQRWYDKGLLKFHADRPNRHGLETHLLEMHHAVEVFDPDVVVIDPMTNLMAVGTQSDVRAMLTRVIDYLKTRGITALFTSLTTSAQSLEVTEAMISSLMDTWILVAINEEERKRNRWLYVLKSRGMPHSNEVRAFDIGDRGVNIPPLGKRVAAARPVKAASRGRQLPRARAARKAR